VREPIDSGEIRIDLRTHVVGEGLVGLEDRLDVRLAQRCDLQISKKPAFVEIALEQRV